MAGNPNLHNCVSVDGTKLKWKCGLPELEKFLKSCFSRDVTKEELPNGDVKFALVSPLEGYVTSKSGNMTLLCQGKGKKAEEIKSRISNEARSWEHPNNQSSCNGRCDGNPIYADHKHTKQRKRILGSRAQFCAAFYHVHEWTDREKFCLAPDNCIIAKRASSENNLKLQPRTVVAMVKYEKVVNGNRRILYEAKYTNCQRKKKHAEDFFKEDVEGGNLGNIIEQHPEGTITMYLTYQPCNQSTTTKGTAVTSPDQSCCETLIDIFTKRLEENDVELCVKPTHLCRIDHHVLSDSELGDNAVKGIKKLMGIEGVTVNAVTEEDWNYLLGMAEFDVLQYIDANADGVERRKNLDEEIGNILEEIRLSTRE